MRLTYERGLVFSFTAAWLLLLCFEVGRLSTAMATNILARCAVRSAQTRQLGCVEANLTSGQVVGRLTARQAELIGVAYAWDGAWNHQEMTWLQRSNEPEPLRSAVTAAAVARALVSQGNDAGALQVLQTQPMTWRVAYNEGWNWVLQGDLERALMWLNGAMAIDPTVDADKSLLYRWTCDLRRHFGDIPGALSACASFRQVAPPASGAYTLTGYVYVQARDYQAARDILLTGLAYEVPS